MKSKLGFKLELEEQKTGIKRIEINLHYIKN